MIGEESDTRCRSDLATIRSLLTALVHYLSAPPTLLRQRWIQKVLVSSPVTSVMLSFRAASPVCAALRRPHSTSPPPTHLTKSHRPNFPRNTPSRACQLSTTPTDQCPIEVAPILPQPASSGCQPARIGVGDRLNNWGARQKHW